MVNLDATLSRSFRLSERVNLQARGEFFILMNHPNYSLIGRAVNDPTFGIVQNQLPPRQIQLALKVCSEASPGQDSYHRHGDLNRRHREIADDSLSPAVYGRNRKEAKEDSL